MRRFAVVASAALVFCTFAAIQDGASAGGAPAAAPASDEKLEIFVALDGDDAWSGLAEKSDGKSGGPMRTPQAALKRVREMRLADPKLRERKVRIQLGEGTWFLDAPLEIGPEESGTPENRFVLGGAGAITGGPPSYPKRPTVLSGGRQITGWRTTKLGEREVWVAAVPDVDGRSWTFRELFVEDRRATRARHPDRGYLAIAGVDGADAAKPWNQGVKSLRAAPSDGARLATIVSSGSADLTLMSRWVESHCRIDMVDAAAGAITLRDPTVFKPDPGDLYYVESIAALDAPGEWWLDEKSKLVYYMPRPGDDPARTVVVAPHLSNLVTIAGGDEPIRRVHDLLITGIRFEGAEWWYPTPSDPAASRPSGAVQAAFDLAAAITVRNAEQVRFAACEVTRCGTYGIELGRGCRDNFISFCRIDDLGGGGVKIGETAIPPANLATAANVVELCEIHDLGRLFHSAVGVWIGQSPDNHVTDCTIGDLYYTGISIGWTWGYGAASAGGNVIERNQIHHVGVRSDGDGPILSDMGGVYTLGIQEGTVVRNNFFHDVAALRYGGWGIYFDEGSTHIEASENFVVNTTHGGFHQHYGKENHVHHNLFAWGRDAQIQRSRPEEHVSFTFDHNVVVAKGGELFAGDLRDGHFDFHDNVYEINEAAAARFAGKSFAEWQAAGRDARSIVAPVDLELQRDEGDQKSTTQVWFAPRDSPIWRCLDFDSISGPDWVFVRGLK